MTDDKELIARLRESQSYEWQDPIWETRLAAADRIEALEAKVKLMDDLDVINGEKIEALTAERDDFADQIANLLPAVNREAVEQRQRAEVAEAKLAKAVGALEYYAVEAMARYFDDSLIARTALAEIKGTHHDRSAA